jgi:homoserine kinase
MFKMSFLFARVRVPATIANLGSGFDCLGLAAGLWLEASAEPSAVPEFVYQGAGSVDGQSNLMHTGWNAAFRELGLEPPSAKIVCQNPIPLARGLGSSSAALVGGAALADAVLGGKLGREGVLRVCTALEGHPDNVAPAVLGGFTTSVMADGLPISVSLPLPQGWRVLVAVPDFELKTAKARAALPEQYSRSDLIFNASRTALWVAALATGRFELLRHACQDQMHQPYRAAFVPRLLETIESALSAGAWAAFLSGAGPSLALLCTAQDAPRLEAVLQAFAPRVLHLEPTGGYLHLEPVGGQSIEPVGGQSIEPVGGQFLQPAEVV